MHETARKDRSAYDHNLEEEECSISRDLAPDKDLDEFPIVGIGASAGGIGALKEFFEAVPENPGMGFVVVLHMSPEHQSILPSIIQRHTVLPTIEAADGIPVQPNHVYVATPRQNLYISGHYLHLAEKPQRPYIAHSIDLFFRSMAESLKDKSIGIILSGMGSDGSFGSRLINQRLGLVVVQDPITAQFAEMPKSVISTGAADSVLPPEKIPEYLMHYAAEFFGKPARERWGTLGESGPAMKELFSLVLERTHVDLNDYKLPTIRRRIQRNMAVRNIGKIEDYVELMKRDPGEVMFFVKLFLSGITRFFQEPQAYSALKNHVTKMMLRETSDRELRAWSIGCGTGEETYSIAILIEECMEELGERRPYLIYSTDIDPHTINLARLGVFPSSIAAEDVAPKRLEKYFEKRDNYYQVKSEIRSKVAFSVHNYMDAVGHSSIDLVSMRAIAPYLNPSAQHRMIKSLSRSMKHGGILFLGVADSMAQFVDLYSTLNPQWKIYSRK